MYATSMVCLQTPVLRRPPLPDRTGTLWRPAFLNTRSHLGPFRHILQVRIRRRAFSFAEIACSRARETQPTKSVKQDTFEFTAGYPWNNKARLVANGKVLNFHSYGFNLQDELELALTSKPERAANDKRINDVFSEHFFETDFWHMWKTLFA